MIKKKAQRSKQNCQLWQALWSCNLGANNFGLFYQGKQEMAITQALGSITYVSRSFKIMCFFYLSSNDLLIVLVLFFLVQTNALIVDKKNLFDCLTC